MTYLTPEEVADLLDAAYLADRSGMGTGPSPGTRADLAELLAGHRDLRAAAWEVWQQELWVSGRDLTDAAAWLDATW